LAEMKSRFSNTRIAKEDGLE
jgi:hypothetical protein